jgi:hypothetical protein
VQIGGRSSQTPHVTHDIFASSIMSNVLFTSQALQIVLSHDLQSLIRQKRS